MEVETQVVSVIPPRSEQRRLKKKKHHPKLITSHLHLYNALKPRNIKGLILGTAVYLCLEDDVVGMFDALCFGNLDGGPGTAAHVREKLSSLGVNIPGDKSVRISLDEAFFMAYALRLITVHGEVNGVLQPLDDDTLWRVFNELRSDFLLLYLGYHHFRSKGWIPRTGLQYGADFVLYQRHPAIGHSEYSLLIIPTNFGNRPAGEWHDLQILNRLTTQVSKQLLLLFVEQQPGCDVSTPACLKQFAVEERLVRRWVPESHRPPPR